MPEVTGPDKEPFEQRQFMREKIIRQPMSRRQIVKRGLAFLFLAVIFGIVAAVSFVAARPYAEKYLGEEPEKESTPITIPKDELETLPTTEPSTASVEETKPIEDILQSAMETYIFSVDDLNALYGDLRIVAQGADKGIVAVHSVKHQTDMFDNPVENTGQYAGAVTALTSKEMLILTPEAAVEEADSIRVAFSDGTEYSGTIKQSDKIAGMALVSVNVETIDPEVLKGVVPIPLGNSYATQQGDIVISIGSPAGIIHSSDYGMISYISRNVQVADGVTRVIYTSLASNVKKGTFLVNTDGQLIGWMVDDFKKEGSESLTAVRGISDYKVILEKMSNGSAVPYFGIIGQEVTASMGETGLPQGVYVVNSIADGPAYNAGIQNGDIITKVGDKEIITLKELQSQIESLTPEHPVSVMVHRNGRDEYKELEYQVMIGAR